MVEKGMERLIKLFKTNTGFTVDEIFVKEFRQWLGKNPVMEDRGWLKQKMIEYVAGEGY